jgi:2,3-bisphosphoglycerate-independent phosphoglycerate mutase
MIVLCGGADRPIRELGNRTPLDAATTPALDRLARHAHLGLVTVIDHGICPESDSGMMALLGYDPHRYYTGRGALEALGLDFMERGENAVGFRINFASYDVERAQLDRRTARDLRDDELQALCAAIREAVDPAVLDAEVAIVAFGRHRGIVCLRSGRPLSAAVSNTDPGFRRVGAFGVPNDRHEPHPLPCVPLDDSPAAAWTAELVNRLDALTGEVLAQHPVNRARRVAGRSPANRLLFRDAGSDIPHLHRFPDRYRRTLAIYGQVPAERGLCKLLGGTWHDARQQNGVNDVDYHASLVDALLADPADFVVVHHKGPDEPGHDGQAEAKRDAIEQIDRLLIEPLAACLGGDDTLIVACDHATPCDLRIHAPDAVPVMVHRRGTPERAQRYCERDAARGDLGVSRAPALLERVLAKEVS